MFRDKTKGRKKLVSDYTINGEVEHDKNNIPKIIAQVWSDFIKNKSECELLYDYYFNDTAIKDKVKEQRPDINNQFAIPRAFEIQRKINSYANGTPREYTALSTEKQELIQTFNNYQLNECKHSKTQLANYYASICGIGYYCVLPEYEKDISTYEIYDENFTPFNTFIVYENTIKDRELIGVNFYNKEIDGKTFTEFNVFTKYHQFIFRTPDVLTPSLYSIVLQQMPTINALEYKEAIPIPFEMIPIIEVKYHPFRIGIFEIVLDLIDCINLFFSGDADAMQQAVDYVMVLTDCQFEEEVDENGKPIPANPKSKRLIQIKTNGGATQAKVEILTNNITNDNSINFIEMVNTLIEKIVGIPTRKNQESSIGSSTGIATKNENGMRDLDDNADIIQAQALLSEKKFIKLVLGIDSFSPSKKLSGLQPIDINVSFPRNEKENILVSAQAYNLLSGGKPMAEEDSLKYSNMTTDIVETAKRIREAEQRQIDLEVEREKRLAEARRTDSDSIEEIIETEEEI